MSPLRKKVDAHLKAMCEELGFIQRDIFFYRDEGNGFFSTLAFGHASYQMRGHIFVDCLVGVSHRLLYDYFADNAGFKRPKYPNNIIQTGLGILKSNLSLYEWDITEQTDMTKLCKKISKEIKKYAYPYYKKYLNLDSYLESCLTLESGIMYNNYIWLSIMYYLKNDIPVALHYLDKIEHKEGPYRYNSPLDENFDKNFRKLLINDESSAQPD